MLPQALKRRDYPGNHLSAVDLRSRVIRPSTLRMELGARFDALSTPARPKKSKTDKLVLFIPMTAEDYVRALEVEPKKSDASPAKSRCESFKELTGDIPLRYSKLDICRELSRMPSKLAHAYSRRLRSPQVERDMLQVIGGFKRGNRPGQGGKFEKTMHIMSCDERLLTRDLSLGFVLQNLGERPAHFVGLRFTAKVTRVSGAFKKVGATKTTDTSVHLFDDLYIIEEIAPESNIEDFIIENVTEELLAKYIKKEMRSFQVKVDIEVI